MGIGDSTALPPHLDEKEERENAFPDDSQFGNSWFGKAWKWWQKTTKTWEAFGWRSPVGVALSLWPPWILFRKWRFVPKVLWAKKGKGYWRFESDGKPDLWDENENPSHFLKIHPEYYLSRQQLWCSFSFALQWPLFACYHEYFFESFMMSPGKHEKQDGHLWFFYIGAKRDTDCFWFPAVFLGRTFK